MQSNSSRPLYEDPLRFLNFHVFSGTATHLCPACRSLWHSSQLPDNRSDCPRCTTEVQASADVEWAMNWASYAREYHLETQEKRLCDPLTHLLRFLNRARRSIHFVTTGIDSFFAGALKTASLSAQVRGVVYRPHASVLPKLESFSRQDGEHLLQKTPEFQVRIFGEDDWKEAPHTKIIMVDGIFAALGSANLTFNAWEKIVKGREHVEFLYEGAKIQKLHNRYFVPPWNER